MSAVGQVYRWSSSHGKFGEYCVILIVDGDDRNGYRCVILDGNSAPGYNKVGPGHIKTYGWRWLNQMKRVL